MQPSWHLIRTSMILPLKLKRFLSGASQIYARHSASNLPAATSNGVALTRSYLFSKRVAITSRMAGRSDPALREAWLEIQATLSTGYHDPFLGCCLPR